MKTISSTQLPEKCWIFEDHRYSCNKGYSYQLPWISQKYEAILKANNIPYKKDFIRFYSPDSNTVEVCTYWSPEIFEEEDITLPLFAKMPDGSYKYCEKSYTGKIITDGTFYAANQTKDFIEAEVSEYEKILRNVGFYLYSKDKLAGEYAKMYHTSELPYTSIYDIDMNYDKFKLLRVFGHFYPTEWVAIFDINKIRKDQVNYICLEVPRHIAGMVIGLSGSNIQAWAREIGVKRIEVVPV